MFVIAKEHALPVKVWQSEEAALDAKCLEQASHLARLPFAEKWIALMPDAHAGMGMPIGGVIACENAVIPNAVGVDIGCGMAFAETGIPVQLLRETETGSGNLAEMICGNILKAVPTGFAHHRQPQTSAVLDHAKAEAERYAADAALLPQIDEGYFQAGTLGGGNHFIELQEDENGMCCIMLHSGSRHFGNIVGVYFKKIAAALNARWHSAVDPAWNLSFLPADTDEGQRYLAWMQLCMDFAYENRAKMLAKVQEIFCEAVTKYTSAVPAFTGEINCHHNYAALEHHFGKNLYVHRKGAIRAGAGELAIIPGAMGSYSYIVRGKGNPMSFCSSSHGAGRSCSRTAAMERYPAEAVMDDLRAQNVVLAKHNPADVAEEARFAYKDINQVMAQQTDLVEPVRRLFTVGVVKG